MASMADVRELLDRFTPRPETAHSVNLLDLSIVQNEQDRKYLYDVIVAMKSLDPGNPSLNIGFRIAEGQYRLWLLHFKGQYTQTSFEILSSVRHPVPNWNPIRKNSISVSDAGIYGTSLYICIDPLPNTMLSLPPPPQQMVMLPAPVPSPEAVPQRQLLMPASNLAIVPVVQEPPPQRKERERDASPKRDSSPAPRPKQQNSKSRRRRKQTGFLTGLARAVVGPRNSSSSSSE